MKNRLKKLYLNIGRVLNNPSAFGLEERMPSRLAETLTNFQLELLEELRDQGVEEDFLAQELSQDADRRSESRFKSPHSQRGKRKTRSAA